MSHGEVKDITIVVGVIFARGVVIFVLVVVVFVVVRPIFDSRYSPKCKECVKGTARLRQDGRLIALF